MSDAVQLGTLSVSAPGPSEGRSTPPASGTKPSAPFSFHELLSELNPLQYIPVVGTIYRSVTGDTIPESVRTAGSLVFSGLTGGPVGLATSAAMLGLEKAFGIDPERIGHQVLASIGIGKADAAPTDAGSGGAVQEAGPATMPATDTSTDTSPADASSLKAWSPVQLAAYGISTTGAGDLVRGDVMGSDVLNNLVLANLEAKPTLPGASPTTMAA